MYETRDLLLQLIDAIPAWFWVLWAWEVVWKLIALWRSARDRRLVWFLVITFTNTVGIIPIFYLWWSCRSRRKNLR